MSKLRVDIWSDIACPWCYVGKRRLEAAVKRLAKAEQAQIEVVWRAFELDPGAPRERDRGQSYAERISRKYGTPLGQAKARLESLTQLAKIEGLEFDFERIRPGNTFDAHRLVHLAAENGLQDAVKERFLHAYLSEGEPIGATEALQRLGTEAGLPPGEVAFVLSGDRYAANVRADEEEARELGINGVPFFVFDGQLAVSGAQPVELLLSALKQAFAGRAAKPALIDEGATCGPNGC